MKKNLRVLGRFWERLKIIVIWKRIINTKSLANSRRMWPAVQTVNISRRFRGAAGSYRRDWRSGCSLPGCFSSSVIWSPGLRLLEFSRLFIREVIRLIPEGTFLLCQACCWEQRGEVEILLFQSCSLIMLHLIGVIKTKLCSVQAKIIWIFNLGFSSNWACSIGCSTSGLLYPESIPSFLKLKPILWSFLKCSYSLSLPIKNPTWFPIPGGQLGWHFLQANFLNFLLPLYWN